jgi:hypothetical protein
VFGRVHWHSLLFAIASFADSSGGGLFFDVPVDQQIVQECPQPPAFWQYQYFTLVTISNSTVSNNVAGRANPSSGGGLHLVAGGRLSIKSSHFTGNSASLFGGGLAIAGDASTCALTLESSTVSDNVGAHGGAQLYMDASGAVAIDSTSLGLGTGSQASGSSWCIEVIV